VDGAICLIGDDCGWVPDGEARVIVRLMGTRTRRLRGRRAQSGATRLMGAFFTVGATGFVIGPLSAYAGAVGAYGDALTFFISSILFTAGGLTQSWLAYPERRDHRAGRLAWRAAWIQSAGTFLFNVMTLEAISRSPGSAHYDTLVWGPNVIGSACFLVSGVLLYLSAPREGWRPRRRADGWWEPPVNLLGCILFGVSALTGFAVRSSGRLLAPVASNWTTTVGAACFLAIGAAPLILGMTFKVPRLSRLVAFERTLRRDLGDVESGLEAEAQEVVAEVQTAEREADQEVRAMEREGDARWREGDQELARVERLSGSSRRVEGRPTRRRGRG
jgi:hypothetical protein